MSEQNDAQKAKIADFYSRVAASRASGRFAREMEHYLSNSNKTGALAQRSGSADQVEGDPAVGET